MGESATAQGALVEIVPPPGTSLAVPLSLADDGTQAFFNAIVDTQPSLAGSRPHRWRLGRAVDTHASVARYSASCMNGDGTASGGHSKLAAWMSPISGNLARWDAGLGVTETGMPGRITGFTPDSASTFGWAGVTHEADLVYWRRGSTPTVLFDPGHLMAPEPLWMSDDGTRAIGTLVEYGSHFQLPSLWSAFVWDSSGGMTALSPTQDRFRLTDVSSDGATAVGHTQPVAGDPTPYVWRDGTGFAALGAIPLGAERGAVLNALTADGLIAGGTAFSNGIGGNKPFLWSQASGPYPLFGPTTGIVDPFPQEDVHLVDLSATGDAALLTVNQTMVVVYLSPPPSHQVSAPTCVPPAPNSAGSLGACWVEGTALIVYDDLVLHATDLPPSQFGFFILGTEEASIPLSSGTVCLTGSIGRLLQSLANTGVQGTLEHPLDLQSLPIGSPNRPAMSGETFHFQAWYRDTAPAGSFNLTGGAKVLVR